VKNCQCFLFVGGELLVVQPGHKLFGPGSIVCDVAQLVGVDAFPPHM
jgi:hypothetical protein